MRTMVLASTALTLIAGLAAAQTDPAAPQPGTAQQQEIVQQQQGTVQQQATGQQQGSGQEPGTVVAERCLENLRLAATRIDEEGYWFSGYRQDWGWRGQGMPPAPADPVMADPAVADPAMDPTVAAAGRGPWGATDWGVSPGHDIRILQSAAAVLARQGDQEGCEYLVARMEETYDRYAENLREAGIEPGQVSTWRQEQIAAAVPVNELGQVVSLDSIIGTEVRSLKDERLGSVEDVVMDPDDGGIAYVVVAHGGFLGFGQDYAAVPWDMLYATPGFETLLLDAPPEALENAPSVDLDRLTTREAYADARQTVDGYWQRPQ